MRFVFLTLLLFFPSLHAQNKDLTLEDIWINGTFEPETLESFHSMSSGDFYTVLNRNSYGSYIDKFDYSSLERLETLVHSKDLEGIASFDDYSFDPQEKKLLLATGLKDIYRHSKEGKYYVYDLATRELELVSQEDIQEPAFSPDGKKVAYAFGNNLYVKDLETGETRQITFDGKKNQIINGIADWVYEEEFSFVRAFEWNGNSDMIAYLRFDESQVPEFSMDIYGTSLYPQREVFKYPKAGEKNSEVTLQVYDLSEGSTSLVNLGEYGQHYLPRIQWTKDPYILSAITLNRHQNNLNLVAVNAKENSSALLLNEKDEAYVDIHDNLEFLEDNRFIWTSERDGFNHLYLYDGAGKLKQQITSGPWEVTEVYGYDPKTKRIFYQSSETGSINRGIYSIRLSGRDKKNLSSRPGQNEASFSKSFRYFVNTHSSSTQPTAYFLAEAQSGKEIRVIKSNDGLEEKLAEYRISPIEFTTLKTKNGEFNMYMIKPLDFDPNKKYPLLMYQYSGPGSQSVVNRWKHPRRQDYWHQLMAQKGYVIACVDGRGTGFKGRDFKKVTYLQLGKYEVEDQIESAKELGKLPYIDESRIGIWGWSYGGHMSSLAITKGAEVFSLAIAVAPVTSWRFYDTVYTERFMRTPQENPEGYDDNSPINFAHLLQGDYLLIHGTGDDNVHVQNSMRMIDALVEANKQFDYFEYPDRTHGISEGNKTRLHLYTKMTRFIDEHLGTHENQTALDSNVKL